MALETDGSSFSLRTRKWIFDVFLSFRGEDTRHNFLRPLYAALTQKGIPTFTDEKELERGKPIPSELLKAIEGSRFSVVIFSKNYGSSSWCLDELAKIVECQKKMGQTIFPVFFDVDPTDVRKQKGSFREAFAKHEEVFKENLEKVRTWRTALTKVANISGWVIPKGQESEYINAIVEKVFERLSSIKLVKDLVGIDSRVWEVYSDLKIGLSDVRVIGIDGTAGIGKTTIARVVYDSFSNQFEGSSFLHSVREESEVHGLAYLQERLLCDILMQKDIKIYNTSDGVQLIRRWLCNKKVLLVLDDVDSLEQSKSLACMRDCCGPGSRIIITTRNEHLLKRLRVDGIYRPKQLSSEEALRLFSLECFRSECPPEGYMEMSNQVASYAHGLPLAIKFLGSSLFDRTIPAWRSYLDMLENNFPPEILRIFQISFDSLQETEKEIFLHIACFFNGEDQDRVEEVLDYLNLYPAIGIRVLIDKSLLSVSSNNRLWMHPLVQQMGKEITFRESPKSPWERRRLWLQNDIDLVLTNIKETTAIQSIVLDLPVQKEVHWNPEAFSKMHHLVLLKIHNVQLRNGLTHFPNELRVIEWNGFPLKSLPPNFEPRELVELRMCHSNIKLLWKGVKHLGKLRFIKLSHSQDLIKTPDFSEAPQLESIDFEGCTNLIEVHQSVGVLKRLILLNLKDCTSLVSLPSKLEMESLENLTLSGCSKVKKIPEFAKDMKRLRELHLSGTAVVDLPSSIKHLTGLTLLNLSHCRNLLGLPGAVYRLESLKEFIVFGCSKLAEDDSEISPARKRSIWLLAEEFVKSTGRRVRSRLI